MLIAQPDFPGAEYLGCSVLCNINVDVGSVGSFDATAHTVYEIFDFAKIAPSRNSPTLNARYDIGQSGRTEVIKKLSSKGCKILNEPYNHGLRFH